MTSSGELPSQCATCRQVGTLSVSEELRGGELVWTERFACECGHGFEASGKGLPAPALRKAIVRKSGRAEVWLDEPQHRAAVSRLLKNVLNMTDREAGKRLSKLPAVAFVGTPSEAAFFAHALTHAKVTVRVVTHLPPPAAEGTP